MKLSVRDLGKIPYAEALSLQKTLRDKRIAGDAPDTLLLLEHPPVITLGRRAAGGDILLSSEAARKAGVEIVRIDRGGEVTYHGPGQLVGYLIFHLGVTHGSIKKFVHLLEESIILTLRGEFSIESGRDPEHHGVWIGSEKAAAVGLSVSRQVTMHGFALNVNTDLDHFKWIVPCGIRDRGTTSIEKKLGRRASMEDVKAGIIRHVAAEFGFDTIEKEQT